VSRAYLGSGEQGFIRVVQKSVGLLTPFLLLAPEALTSRPRHEAQARGGVLERLERHRLHDLPRVTLDKIQSQDSFVKINCSYYLNS
jgi:hypothetical protein